MPIKCPSRAPGAWQRPPSRAVVTSSETRPTARIDRGQRQAAEFTLRTLVPSTRSATEVALSVSFVSTSRPSGSASRSRQRTSEPTSLGSRNHCPDRSALYRSTQPGEIPCWLFREHPRLACCVRLAAAGPTCGSANHGLAQPCRKSTKDRRQPCRISADLLHSPQPMRYAPPRRSPTRSWLR
jgi:hypothetical protein